MKKFNEFNPIRNIGVGAAVLALALVFSFMFLIPKAHAQKKYFNSYYFSLNVGGTQIKPASWDGLSFANSSVGTLNLSFGKNWNINNFVIGGVITLGATGNTTWTFSEYGDNLKYALTRNGYFIAAIKAGYAFKNIMPFVKLGYMGYSDHSTISLSGPSFPGSPSSSENVKRHGLMYGVGVEYMLNQTWGISAQYFGSSLSGGSTHEKIKIANYTIGVDYNF